MTSFIKDPDAVLDFTRNWSAWLAEVDDTIETSSWTVPDGIEKTNESHTDTTATIWLAGGEVDSTYQLTNRITTAGGRTDERTFSVEIRQR